MAEAAAARYGVMIARRFGFTKVCLEGDSLSVVSSLCSKQLGFAPIFSLFSDVLTLSEVFTAISFCHVRRAGNTVAHLMARWNVQGNVETVCTNSFPQSILTLAEMDLI